MENKIMTQDIILFEHPRIASPEHYNDVANAPLSACMMSGYCAALLREHGLSVHVHEAYLTGHDFDACLDDLSARPCRLLGVHAVYFWEHTHRLFAFLNRFKILRPDVPVVLYGFFPTFSGNEILEEYACVDAVIVGEPELTLLQLGESLRGNGRTRFEGSAGVVFRDGDRTVANKKRDAIRDLDSLPFPERSDTFMRHVGATVLGSRGCYGCCSFCCINPFYGMRSGWRGRSPEAVVREVAGLVPRLQRNYIYFLDANFFATGRAGLQRAVDIADRLRDFKLTFGIECRCNDVENTTFGTLAAAGLRDVFLGIESGSAAALGRMNKGVRRCAAGEALAVLRDKGIEPSLGFIMFDADSTLQDVRDNYDFLCEHHLLDRLANAADVLYHREIVLRGMPRYDELNSRGRLMFHDATGHEGCYRFPDPGVAMLASLMSTVCRRVLRAMENPGSQLNWRNGDTPLSQRMSEYLAGLFGSVLERLERNDIRSDSDTLSRLEAEAVQGVEGMIVEERVCQP